MHNIPGSIHQGFAVITFVKMGFEADLKLRVQLAVYEGGDKLPNFSATNFNDQHSWPSFPGLNCIKPSVC